MSAKIEATGCKPRHVSGDDRGMCIGSDAEKQAELTGPDHFIDKAGQAG